MDMADDPNSKYVRKDVCAERFENIILRFTHFDERLDRIEEAINKQQERSWQSGWRFATLLVGIIFGGGTVGGSIVKLLDHLAKP